MGVFDVFQIMKIVQKSSNALHLTNVEYIIIHPGEGLNFVLWL